MAQKVYERIPPLSASLFLLFNSCAADDLPTSYAVFVALCIHVAQISTTAVTPSFSNSLDDCCITDGRYSPPGMGASRVQSPTEKHAPDVVIVGVGMAGLVAGWCDSRETRSKRTRDSLGSFCRFLSGS